MHRLPGAIVITDMSHEHIAVAEARRLRIPIIGICDTNVNPELCEYPIPANDDAVKSVQLILNYLAEQVVPRTLEGGRTNVEQAAGKFDNQENVK